MIAAEADFAALAVRLARRAADAAQARAESLQVARRGDGSHWRRAALVWPHFTKG